jgi:HlyD family secretion protein
MRKKIIAILILLAAVGGFAYWFLQREERSDTGEMKLFGNVEIREVMLSFRIGGRLETLRFEEGARVSSGDLLAVLDKTPYAIQVQEANAALLAAQANLEKMRHGYEDDDIRAARAQRDQVAVSLRNAEANYRRFKELYDQNIVAQKEFDDAVSARDGIRAELSAAESNLHRLRGGFRSEDIMAAEAQAEAAQAQLDEARTSLDDAEIYAPDDGTIATRVAEPGSVVAAGQPVYSMMLARPIQVRAYVTEPQLGRVRLGMKGRVYTDSHPNEPIEGTVSFIAQSAEFTPKQVQTEDTRTDLVYRIRLLIQDNPQDRLKNGMPVTVVLDEEGE